MEYVSERRAHCPFCGEPISVVVDSSAGSQTYIEDCEVCCRPMQVIVEVDLDGYASVQVESAS